MTDDQIHWFSIINSLMIVLFLTGMVAMIMMRTLHADVRRYREMAENAEEAQEETGWKLVHGDVFRAPSHPMLLAVSVGNGVQVFAMTVVTMIFAVLGFLSPANRGALMTAMVRLSLIINNTVVRRWISWWLNVFVVVHGAKTGGAPRGDGHLLRLLLGAHLQDVQGQEPDEEHPRHRHALPLHRLHHLLRPQHYHHGPEDLWRRALPHSP
jgi:hypothetical protein